MRSAPDTAEPDTAERIMARIASLVATSTGFEPTGATAPELEQLEGALSRLSSWTAGLRARVGAARHRVGDPSPNDRPAPVPLPARHRRRPPRPSGPGSRSALEARRQEDAATGAQLSDAFAQALTAGRLAEDHLIALGRVRNPDDVATHEEMLLAAAEARSADEFSSWLRSWDDERDAARGADTEAPPPGQAAARVLCR